MRPKGPEGSDKGLCGLRRRAVRSWPKGRGLPVEGSVDADAEARAEDRAASDEDAGDEPREERGDFAALEAADLPAHFMPPTVFTDSKVAYTRRLPLANVVVRQL